MNGLIVIKYRNTLLVSLCIILSLIIISSISVIAKEHIDTNKDNIPIQCITKSIVHFDRTTEVNKFDKYDIKAKLASIVSITVRNIYK